MRAKKIAATCVALSALAVACTDSTTAPPHRTLAFAVQPSHTVPNTGISPPIQVEILDDTGARQTTAFDAVTLALGANTTGASLLGTLTLNAVNGVATFPAVALTKTGLGYTLTATGQAFSSVESTPFHVVSPVAVVVAGGTFSCATAVTGGTYCWGLNNAGQLGNGTTVSSNVPVPVSGGLSFIAMHAGGAHVCGLTTADEVYCWGPNGEGELGDGSTMFSRVPTRVSGGLMFVALSEGGTVGGHTCAITTDTITVCWGHNLGGQLGNGTTDYSTVPVPVAGDLRFVTLTTGGGAHSCGITTDSTAYCWGYNDNGRLGTGTTISSSIPAPVAGGRRFVQISAGGAHTCGVTETGAAYCWGDNFQGELGNGLMANDSVPVLVSGGLQFTAVTGGLMHTCGRTTTGAAYCWGSNGSGQLGTGLGSRSTTPALVAGSLTFAMLSAGQFHTCGIVTTGATYCWGAPGDGQLGDGTNTTRRTPSLVHLAP